METSISEVVESFKDFLTVKYRDHSCKFINRLKDDELSAIAEALIFSYLRYHFKEVIIGEDISDGGVDFIVNANGINIFAEITSLNHTAMNGHTGLNETIQESPHWFSQITNVLRTKASDKAKQLSGHHGPRILFIVSDHISNAFNFGSHAAEELLIGGSKYTVPLNDTSGNVKLKTCLENSVFFRLKSGELRPCRKSISAIILVDVTGLDIRLVGLLHPEPVHKLNYKLFSTIPFIRVSNWPVQNNTIDLEWVVGSPSPAKFEHTKVMMTAEELKKL